MFRALCRLPASFVSLQHVRGAHTTKRQQQLAQLAQLKRVKAIIDQKRSRVKAMAATKPVIHGVIFGMLTFAGLHLGCISVCGMARRCREAERLASGMPCVRLTTSTQTWTAR
jgi:hypothetical protein